MSTYILYMVCLNIACDLVHTAIAVRCGKQIYQNLPTVKKPHRTKNDQWSCLMYLHTNPDWRWQQHGPRRLEKCEAHSIDGKRVCRNSCRWTCHHLGKRSLWRLQSSPSWSINQRIWNSGDRLCICSLEKHWWSGVLGSSSFWWRLPCAVQCTTYPVQQWGLCGCRQGKGGSLGPWGSWGRGADDQILSPKSAVRSSKPMGFLEVPNNPSKTAHEYGIVSLQINLLCF